MGVYIDKKDLDNIIYAAEESYHELDRCIERYKKESNLTNREKAYLFDLMNAMAYTTATRCLLRDLKEKEVDLDTYKTAPSLQYPITTNLSDLTSSYSSNNNFTLDSMNSYKITSEDKLWTTSNH